MIHDLIRNEAEPLARKRYSIFLSGIIQCHKLPIPNILDIRRYQYALEKNEASPIVVRYWIQVVLVIHFTTPKVFSGSDLIHVVDSAIHVTSHVPTNKRKLMIKATVMDQGVTTKTFLLIQRE